jgi:penicillin-insensitive murein endopeptidase
MRLSVFLLLLINSIISLASSNEWAKVTQPTKAKDSPQSIGTYTAGCLSGAAALPINGNGYQVMRLTRSRFYGHPDLLGFIEKLGNSAAMQHWGVLLIGDLGQPRGGPTLTGHRSHQTGLDVDIWYRLAPEANDNQLSIEQRETWVASSVLAEKSDAISTAHWSPINERILETAANFPEVERIFVNPSIKRQLCGGNKGQNWLRKIRPWRGHDDHFHVRLRCPGNNPACRTQDAIPKGDGCDASLAWWFSAEAKAEMLIAKKPQPVPMPLLPAQCETVLNE